VVTIFLIGLFAVFSTVGPGSVDLPPKNHITCIQISTKQNSEKKGFVISSELFGSNARGKAMGVIVFVHWLSISINTTLIPTFFVSLNS
jgi:hypothetical protein